MHLLFVVISLDLNSCALRNHIIGIVLFVNIPQIEQEICRCQNEDKICKLQIYKNKIKN
jgi:hypothetical protein